MVIRFEKDYLKEMYFLGKTTDKKYRFQPQVIRKYIRVIDILDSVSRQEDLFRFNALHYERLKGDKNGLESVRINDQYRIEFRTTVDENLLVICNIIELSNHYKG
ncbi:MAG: type II toxin-antitoxin system RelE/ParE family toxin [Bacteroidales bacterium]|nr:type II toxin-antitoxin system RelE/ParE family toxin [Bacteroidales bacterium]